MDVREELRSLAASAPRTAPDDGVAVYRRGRQRVVRRRAGAGLTGLALVALLVAVAWPGTVPGGLVIEDEIAEQPDADAPVLDLPDGWQQVEVGDAVFGVPGDREIVEVGADEGLPCASTVDGRYAYVLQESFSWDREAACPEIGPSDATVYAAPLALVPDPDDDLAPGLAWEETSVNGTDAEEIVINTSDGGDLLRYLRYPTELGGYPSELVEFRIGDEVLEATYTSEDLDLWLRFANLDVEPDLAEAVVATVAPTTGAPSDAPISIDPSPDDGAADGDTGSDGGPDGEREFEVGQATVEVPEAFTIERVTPEDETSCLREDTSPTAHVAADGAPFQAAPCDLEAEPSTTSVLITPLSTVPPAWLPGHADVDGPEPAWEPIELGGAEAERVDHEPDGVLVVRSEELDLYLEVAGAERDPELVDELLGRIGPRDGTGPA